MCMVLTIKATALLSPDRESRLLYVGLEVRADIKVEQSMYHEMLPSLDWSIRHRMRATGYFADYPYL